MQLEAFVALIAQHGATLAALQAAQTYVMGALQVGTLLTDPTSAETYALHVFTAPGSDEAISTLLEALANKNNKDTSNNTPVLIDLSKAVALYLDVPKAADRKSRSASSIETALVMARVNFMGTDGIRGKVQITDKASSSSSSSLTKHCLHALVHDNALTPPLVQITALSFATMMLQQGKCQPGDVVVIGNDGRDAAYNWQLNAALQQGFAAAGFNVIDVGVVPTAVVPWQMLQRGHRAAGGACLTASHNPSNQNGVKFFINGNKLLPEGPLGDYFLSAHMFAYSQGLVVQPPAGPAGTVTAVNVLDKATQWMLQVLPRDMPEILSNNITLLFDSANGATHDVAVRMLDQLMGTANYTLCNETPTGDNINRACGVAEIEGTDVFHGTDYASHILFVQKVFDTGRQRASAGSNNESSVWGVTVDGDGDRGFLLLYDETHDAVHVLDGDKCGYLLAQNFMQRDQVDPAQHWFLSTIESDIMTASAAAQNLGLQTSVVSVGDKWIGNFAHADQLAVGVEISGHVIFPIAVPTLDGRTQTLLSGVGILTGLLTLAAVKSLGLSQDQIIQPFPPGFSKTFYVYFVDKTKHFRGSAIWHKDVALVHEAVEAAKAAGQLPADAQIVLQDKEDAHVLYMNIKSGDQLLGVLFMRNSGTEDKNATYVKGDVAYESVLVPIGKRVQAMHMQEMKNKFRIEYRYEKLMMGELAQKGDSTVEALLTVIAAAGESVTETDLFSVLHGLKKEGRIVMEGRHIRLHESETKVWPL